MQPQDRRCFVKRSLASSAALTTPAFFSGLIRAHGEEGETTTTGPWGATVPETTLSETTIPWSTTNPETTDGWGDTTLETSEPETTAAPEVPLLRAYSKKLYIKSWSGNGWTLTTNPGEAMIFTTNDAPQGAPVMTAVPPNTPTVGSISLDLTMSLNTNTSKPLKSGYPKASIPPATATFVEPHPPNGSGHAKGFIYTATYEWDYEP